MGRELSASELLPHLGSQVILRDSNTICEAWLTNIDATIATFTILRQRKRPWRWFSPMVSMAIDLLIRSDGTLRGQHDGQVHVHEICQQRPAVTISKVLPPGR
jgi:hypothetical protein